MKKNFNLKLLQDQENKYLVSVPWWPSNFTAEKYKTNKIRRGRLIFHLGAKQKLCLKNTEIP